MAPKSKTPRTSGPDQDQENAKANAEARDVGTRPKLNASEVPLDPETTRRFISSLGADLVLVGGQALAFWMNRFDIDLSDLSDGAAITNDGDALGKLQAAKTLSKRLGGNLLIPPATRLTSIVAQVLLPKGDGKAANIDILHLLYTTGGLKKSREFTNRVIERSVEVQLEDGIIFRVMDPFDVLDSRVQNAAGLLEDKGPHVLTQAQWAIQVASAVLLVMARSSPATDTADTADTADTDVKRLGAAISSIFKLAHSKAGLAVWRDHQIDVLAAIDVKKLKRLSPAHEKQLTRVHEAQRARLAALVVPATAAARKAGVIPSKP